MDSGRRKVRCQVLGFSTVAGTGKLALPSALVFITILTQCDPVRSVSFILSVSALRVLIYSVESSVDSTKSGASCDGLVDERRIGSEGTDSRSISICLDDADSSWCSGTVLKTIATA